MTALPLAPEDRSPYPDALRAVALLGILMVNAPMILRTGSELFGGAAQSPSPWALAFLSTFFMGKFYGLFSLLFGMGFAVQMVRFDQASRPFLRRLAALALLGAAHGLLLWYGDILLTYAWIGLLLLAFRRVQDRTLIIWVVALLGSGLLLYGLLGGAALLAAHTPGLAEPMRQGMAQAQAQAAQAALETKAYALGPYATLLRQRLNDLAGNYGGCLVVAPHIFSMFLLGVWVQRKGILQNPADHAPFLKRLVVLALPLGLLLSALSVWVGRHGGASSLLALSLYIGGAPLLTLGYLGAFLRLASGPLPGLLRLAPMGRMALTHYLTHSLVFTTLAYFYGFGLHMKVSLPWIFPMALGLWSLQALLSPAWLRRFRFGPGEWVWRKLTYGQPAMEASGSARTASSGFHPSRKEAPTP